MVFFTFVQIVLEHYVRKHWRTWSDDIFYGFQRSGKSDFPKFVIFIFIFDGCFKRKEEGKDQESIQSSTKLGPGYRIILESDKYTRKYHKQESHEVNPFPTGDHKSA